MKNKILSLENREIEVVECESCKSYMFELMILEKQLKDALENKSFEKHVFEKKNLSRNKYVPKNKVKRTRRVWVEKGTAHYTKYLFSYLFLLHETRAYIK